MVNTASGCLVSEISGFRIRSALATRLLTSLVRLRRESMNILRRVVGRWRSRRPRYALALAGGGVIGGMYEVGVIAAFEDRHSDEGDLYIYVGCSPGSVV